MAALQQSVSVSTASRARSNLVAARPIPQQLCFQHALRQPQQQAAARRGAAARQVSVATAAGAVAAADECPVGYHWYETMMILKPNLSEEERDRELAKFEAYLSKQECFNINALVKGRSKLAYPIKRETEGTYVLYTYQAKRQTARAVQLLLSNPEAGAEDTVLRHITLCKL